MITLRYLVLAGLILLIGMFAGTLFHTDLIIWIALGVFFFLVFIAVISSWREGGPR